LTQKCELTIPKAWTTVSKRQFQEGLGEREEKYEDMQRKKREKDKEIVI
jgi:hypothetical protein